MIRHLPWIFREPRLVSKRTTGVFAFMRPNPLAARFGSPTLFNNLEYRICHRAGDDI
jgi:hypothetical protein